MATAPCPHLHCLVPIALLATLLTGCGGGDTATPGATPSASVSASPSAPADRESRAPSTAPPRPDTGGPSFGVDRVRWPATAKGAYQLMDSLPRTLGGGTRETSYQRGDEESGAEAIAQYGEVAGLTVAEEYRMSATESGEPELIRAGELLAANFGLVFACAKDSYRGTIEVNDGGYGPGLGAAESSKPMWFSCAIDGAQGNDDFKGHAVGWVSAKTAWLVTAPDQETARSLIAGLHGPTR